MTTAHEALRRLREGNERFASEVHTGERFLRRLRSAKTNFAQKPFAIILGCSDSRVPVESVQANVRQSVERLRHGSAILEHLIDIGQLHVVGAEYSLETGRVEFFDAPPAPEPGPHSPNH